MSDSTYSNTLNKLQDIDRLCSHCNKDALIYKDMLKDLFDISSTLTERSFGPFKELITEGMDDESLWEELQTRNKPAIRYIKNKVLKISKKLNNNKE